MPEVELEQPPLLCGRPGLPCLLHAARDAGPRVRRAHPLHDHVAPLQLGGALVAGPERHVRVAAHAVPGRHVEQRPQPDGQDLLAVRRVALPRGLMLHAAAADTERVELPHGGQHAPAEDGLVNEQRGRRVVVDTAAALDARLLALFREGAVEGEVRRRVGVKVEHEELAHELGREEPLDEQVPDARRQTAVLAVGRRRTRARERDDDKHLGVPEVLAHRHHDARQRARQPVVERHAGTVGAKRQLALAKERLHQRPNVVKPGGVVAARRAGTGRGDTLPVAPGGRRAAARRAGQAGEQVGHLEDLAHHVAE